MAPQLFMKLLKAARWLSFAQPFISAKVSGATYALRNVIGTSPAHAGAVSAAKAARTSPPLRMPLMPRFGRDQFPVRIARGDVARESPYVGDVGDALGAAVDDVAVLVARRADELGVEAHGHLRGARAQFGRGDLGRVDRDEARFHRLAALLALADC